MRRLKNFKICSCGHWLNRTNSTFAGHMADFGLTLFHCHACKSTSSIPNKKLKQTVFWRKAA